MHDCPTCALVLLHTPYADVQPLDANEVYDLFHATCTQCLAPATKSELCADCRHLRLQHLVYCRPQSHNVMRTSVGLPLGTLNDINRVQRCDLHLMAQSAVQIFIAHFKLQDVSIRSLEFFLWIRPVGHKHVASLRGSSPTFSQELQAFTTDLLFPHNDPWRRPDLSAPALIDWTRTKSWWTRCEQFHSTCSLTGQILENLPRGFRLIDVHKRRVISPASSEPCRYVALSYVWGNQPDPSTCTAQVSKMLTYGEEEGLAVSDMPAVIKQAMQICSQMGERYLWVDRLCIIQDDPHDKQVQIKAMAAIFAKALFTIVIADGESMDTVLPGIGKKRTFTTLMRDVDGLLVRNWIPSFSESIPQSAWASRGWTYQEKLLSGRKLYVSPLQLFWVCSHGIISEENLQNANGPYYSDRPRWAHGTSGETITSYSATKGPESDSEDILASYTLFASQYNSKRLSYSSDVYNAFAGILAALYPSKYGEESFIYNLPKQDFDVVLLWYCPQPESQRTVTDTYIPSWTWSSVFGSLSWLPCYGSVVKWSLISSHRTSSIDSSESEGSPDDADPWDEETAHYMALAHCEGCFPRHGCIPPGPDRDTFILEATARWPTYQQFWHDAFASNPSSPTFSPLALPNPRLTYLGTEAQTATVKLQVHPDHGHGCPNIGTWYNILSPSAQLVGLLAPSPLLAVPTYRARFADDVFKVMAISVGRSSSHECSLLHRHGLGHSIDPLADHDVGYAGLPRRRRPASPRVPVVNVLLLGERNGVWTRQAVGWIFLRRWAEMERVVETVVLE